MIQGFNEFLNTSYVSIPIWGFIINLLLSALLTSALQWIYVHYGNSISNRRMFGRNFLLITLTTVLIISIVKSSLALSLGLVGALSIIRFRAAIKEPEELAFIFFAIGIGLGFGANQGLITFISFIVISIIIIVGKKYSVNLNENQNLHLTMQSSNPEKINIEKIIAILSKNCREVDLKRFDETSESLEVSFMINADDFLKVNKAKDELKKIDNQMKVTFLDNIGLF
tara:strand:+ start:119 stop:799 length:681 start_codon:yes stop_codon:yes gene_type:complete